MRKNLNQVKISGKVYSFGDANGRQALELKVSGSTSKNPGTPFIGGIMQVAVDDKGLNVIPVHFTYVTEEYGKTGKKNPNFDILKKIIEENKTWVNVGPDAAVNVRIDGAIALNDFYNADGTLVSSKVVEGSFVSTAATLPKPEERNTFRADMIITSATRKEANPDTETPEKVVLHGAVFNFRNEILPVDFAVISEKGMAYFEDLEPSPKAPVYTKVWGTIDCMTKTTTVTEDSAFGEAAVRTYEKKIRDWTVTGASPESYAFDDEETITGAELQTALQNREVYLADVKKKAEDYRSSSAPAAKATPAAPKASVGGFNF